MFNAKNATVAAALAGAMALTAVGPSQAAPAFANTTAVKSAVPSDVTDVQWRGRRSNRNAAIAGFAAGTVLGLGVAAATRPNYYYYEEPAYAYEPYYYEPAPSYYYSRPRGGYSSQRTVTY